MQILNATAAERRRDLAFSADLTSAENVAKQGATFVGSPTFSQQGMYLDGSSAIYYGPGIARYFNQLSSFSVLIEFTPEFAVSEAVNRYFFDVAPTGRNYLEKQSNTWIDCRLGNTILSFGAMSQFWTTNQRTMLLFTATSGSNYLHLNAHGSVGFVATGWTKDTTACTALHIGQTAAGTNRFIGIIHSFKIFNTLLTAKECADYYE